MQTWKIFRHSLRQVTGNLGPALRVSILPYAVGVAVLLALIGGVMAVGMSEGSTGFGIGFVFSSLIFLTISAVVAVNWHRFILLREAPGWWPALHGGRVLSYIGRLLVIMLAVVVFGLVLGAVILAPSRLLLGGEVIAVLVMAGIGIGSVVLFWRLGLSLPGAAVDGIGLREAWQATRGLTGMLVMLALIYLGFVLLVGIVSAALAALGTKASLFLLLRVLFEIAANWFNLMLGLSILTTLYGHYVEKRDLV